MDTTNKHDWGLIIAGVLLVICSMFFSSHRAWRSSPSR